MKTCCRRRSLNSVSYRGAQLCFSIQFRALQSGVTLPLIHPTNCYLRQFLTFVQFACCCCGRPHSACAHCVCFSSEASRVHTIPGFLRKACTFRPVSRATAIANFHVISRRSRTVKCIRSKNAVLVG